ncbi:hypothetical protein M378DRAFT_362052 [Amanita muscaria Koide BX008]|uniref:Uncharacterized protein n=1 Tax=Amanita muscaria (strain Koide BX008) TaxID=946122 RepID=A0A0C2WNG4_AMAMK|nr:hypothetical protein M378DRAFT_437049 [Amanita muscaria Koide BX008]KIL57788.1 hypothetical protein M378DRAFT_362052 [Amanita muscaria Koide BX008]
MPLPILANLPMPLQNMVFVNPFPQSSKTRSLMLKWIFVWSKKSPVDHRHDGRRGRKKKLTVDIILHWMRSITDEKQWCLAPFFRILLLASSSQLPSGSLPRRKFRMSSLAADVSYTPQESFVVWRFLDRSEDPAPFNAID